jgi:hypothetical protein
MYDLQMYYRLDNGLGGEGFMSLNLGTHCPTFL